MRTWLVLAWFLCCFSGGLSAADLAGLRVIYLTDESRPGRTAAFTSWVKPLVKSLTVVSYSPTRTPTVAELAGDVVLLDWDQAALHTDSNLPWDEQAARYPNPLGTRAEWATPTVLLGSAGLLISYSWSVVGDRGCTCLYPLAYDLREHPVTRGPLAIDRTAEVVIPTPADFREEVSTATIRVLPLVAGLPEQAAHRHPGWCVYLKPVLGMPDVEWISGGVNAKTVTAGGIWRQGNLLHFGFAQSPAELNDNGRHLLANALCYIADFHHDRPIGQQVVGVRGQAYLPPREALVRRLHAPGPQGHFDDYYLKMFAPAERESLITAGSNPVALDQWKKERLPYLAPDAKQAELLVDEHLLRAGLTYDQPEFLNHVVAGLRSEQPTEFQTLAAHYVPDCPTTITPREQAEWLDSHRPWLFANDSAGYRWYLDTWAMKRGVPSVTLRGPARSDQGGPVCDPVTGTCTVP